MTSVPGSRPALAASIWAVALVAAVLGASVMVTHPASGRENPRTREAATAGTPVSSPEDHADPLDGVPDDPGEGGADPLDGPAPIDPAAADDADAPTRLDPLLVERSGRPEGAPSSVVAYDNDPDTVWEVREEAGEAWLWLDLGEGRRVREVRWLATGSGEIEVSVSNDRERWQSVGEAEADRTWQGITLREDARYVRLELAPDGNSDVPAIAEVTVYGRDRASVASAQRADDDNDRRNQNRNRGRRGDRNRDERRSQQRAEQDESSDNAGERGQGKRKRSGGRVTVSAEQGETSCEGRGNRCRARKGQVSIEEDCQEAGTCTIDVNVDGGTAMCEAAGGRRARAGDGEGRAGGNGGRCEAVADGGTVTIGDINP